MTCCREGKFCTCKWGVSLLALALLAVGLSMLFVLSGCAAGKKFERGPDGKMQERVVVGFDVATAAEGMNATIGSLTDPGTLAAIAGVGVPGIGVLTYLLGKFKGKDKGWEEREAHQASIDATYYEGATRSLETPKVAAVTTPETTGST